MRRRLFHALCLGVTACLCAASAWAGLADTVVRVKPSVVLVGTFRTTDNPRFQLRGAGFLVARGDMVVTNAHVLPPDGDEGSLVVQVRVGQGDWQMRTATVLETDVARDLTLLRVSGAPGPALKIGDSRRVSNGTFDIFQLDATAYPGNSGGPLFDPDTGDVMGVMNMVLIKNTRESALSQPSGISYAIPARYVQELVDRHR
jgi:serine protease Do